MAKKSKIVEKMKKDSERGARQQLVEELFYDFNRSRLQIYWLNFTRGLFFGFGTIFGGTVLVALLVWLLSQSVNIFPDVIADWVRQIIDALDKNR